MSHADAGERDLVRAAQRGDRQARDMLVRRCLPLVYGIVGRALSGLPEVDDVVQETMLRVVRDLPALRGPESFRAWVSAIAVHQVGTHRQRAGEALGHTGALAGTPQPGADFEELAILRLRLSGQRREVARAGRWLDDEDRVVLSLWWQEAAGELSRDEVAAALGVTVAYAGVRVQRMRNQLEIGRSVVAALAAGECRELGRVTTGWDGRPTRRCRSWSAPAGRAPRRAATRRCRSWSTPAGRTLRRAAMPGAARKPRRAMTGAAPRLRTVGRAPGWRGRCGRTP
ncbi:RNA polymerase sigma factor [Nonomuraea zeae]|uniref:Sigma-70 family RNA polymerase sigma factor n=1 Tax=Nonomuraea zeae TaxID=1642303 RepID=A0A5S4FW37_9ACTN|nr:sigma-70 family RNA polymerase sigma factor [Nonomuraea zeae]TMR24858.1 sigma-70 family RNA polymerase sigma factor [Nonomuraea zeae]